MVFLAGILLIFFTSGVNALEGSMLALQLSKNLESKFRSQEIPVESDIYARLIGSWDVRIIDYDSAGLPLESRAEWHFSRALEGRAIQDVLIAPPRSERSLNTPKQRNRYGTTVRYYDAGSDVWHIVWINPVRNVQNHLTGRKVGEDIVQEGVDEAGLLMRWSFREITSDSFHWTGEESSDHGKNWVLRAEFFGRRAFAPTLGREMQWISNDGLTTEFLRLTSSEQSVMADGWIIHTGKPSYRIRYEIECDNQWNVQRVELERLGASPGSLLLQRNQKGEWTDESGRLLTELTGATDVDIYASPFTNTLPIRRLQLKQQETKRINVAFVHLPDLRVIPAPQQYSLLKAMEDGAVYRYEGLDSGFTAELKVDRDGFVIEYPGLARRVWIEDGSSKSADPGSKE